MCYVCQSFEEPPAYANGAVGKGGLRVYEDMGYFGGDFYSSPWGTYCQNTYSSNILYV